MTLPGISPTTFFLMIITMVNSLQAYDQIQILTQGGPALVSFFAYREKMSPWGIFGISLSLLGCILVDVYPVIAPYLGSAMVTSPQVWRAANERLSIRISLTAEATMPRPAPFRF